MILLAFDPGVTGAFAYSAPYGSEVFDLPTREAAGFVKREIDGPRLATAIDCILNGKEGVAILERTSSRPGQGVASMFSMGVSRGVILGVLAGLRVPVQEVEPRAWKAYFGLIGTDKDESLRTARPKFPELAAKLMRAKDHNRAEALLLLEYLEMKVRAGQ